MDQRSGMSAKPSFVLRLECLGCYRIFITIQQMEVKLLQSKDTITQFKPKMSSKGRNKMKAVGKNEREKNII